MTRINVTLNQLIQVQEKLPKLILKKLTDDEKNFLLSVKKGIPDWNLLGLRDFSFLPGVKWKLYNLNQLTKSKRMEAINKLEKYLTV